MQLFGANIFDYASVIIDPAYKIADKWNSSTASGAGMSFAHLDTNSFVGSDVTVAGNYALLRIANLNSPLRILGTAPGAAPPAGTVINSAADVTNVILSRPINTPAGLTSFQLTGGGVSAPPLSASAFDYSTGTHKAENVVGLSFAAGGLTDATLDDTVTLTVSLSDTSGTAIVAPDNAISFIASTSATSLQAPQKVPAGSYINALEAAGNISIRIGLAGSVAEEGGTVELLESGTSLGTYTLAADDIAAGNYTFTVAGSSLGADGEKSFVVAVTDAGNTTTETSEPLILTLDTVAPTVTGVEFGV